MSYMNRYAACSVQDVDKRFYIMSIKIQQQLQHVRMKYAKYGTLLPTLRNLLSMWWESKRGRVYFIFLTWKISRGERDVHKIITHLGNVVPVRMKEVTILER